MKNKSTNYNKSGLLIIIILTISIGTFFTVRSNFMGNNKLNKNTLSITQSNINNEEYAEEYIYGCSESTDSEIGSCSMGSYINEGDIKEETTQKEQPTIEELLNYEIVNVGHDQFAMDPETTVLKAGRNYKLIITPTANGGGCMSTLTIPGIDNNVYRIRKDVPIKITIDNAQAGTYQVICGSMGMYQGEIVIE